MQLAELPIHPLESTDVVGIFPSSDEASQAIMSQRLAATTVDLKMLVADKKPKLGETKDMG